VSLKIAGTKILVTLLHPVSRFAASILIATLVLAVAPEWVAIVLAIVALALVIEAVITGTLLQIYRRHQASRESTPPAPEQIAHFARASAAWKN
jgi:hypothetical protein